MKFVIDTLDFEVSRSMIETILENEIGNPVTVTECKENKITKEELDELVYAYNEERQPNYWWEEYCTVCEASEVRDAFRAGYKAAKKGE